MLCLFLILVNRVVLGVRMMDVPPGVYTAAVIELVAETAGLLAVIELLK